MLEQLSKSLFDAISGSDEVHEQLKRLREEGYSLSLLLDCQHEGKNPGSGQNPQRGVRAPLPEFRINGQDLAFLRSVGIDPTRRCRRRKISETAALQRREEDAEATNRDPARD